MKVPSFTNPKILYEVDLEKGLCTCPAFKKGITRPCKHLLSLGAEPVGVVFLDDPKGISVKQKKVRLFTIGHSNLSAKAFIDLLDKHEIKTLVDVRGKPYSRFVHFQRPNLAAMLNDIGVTYYAAGKWLGGVEDTSVKSKKFIEKMERVVELGSEAPTAMMCSEGDPIGCHRAVKLTAHLHRTHKFDLTHILKHGTINSREFEHSQPKSWLWYEFGGEYGGDDD